ncbi:MAG: TOPRIM nucleotidyl transferase/hydrolase domain-containing protein [Candidatus Bathyarchaeales archaeon]
MVLICEGATEKIFIEYLIENKWKDLAEKRVCVLDAMGKYNIHRFMNLFKELGIYHSILLDKDNDAEIQNLINQFIENQKNDFTKKIYFFEKNIETFLGISEPPRKRRDKKPLNVMWHYLKGKITQEKLDELKTIINALLN